MTGTALLLIGYGVLLLGWAGLVLYMALRGPGPGPR